MRIKRKRSNSSNSNSTESQVIKKIKIESKKPTEEKLEKENNIVRNSNKK